MRPSGSGAPAIANSLDPSLSYQLGMDSGLPLHNDAQNTRIWVPFRPQKAAAKLAFL
jgi:hypothetical protein